MNTIAVLLVADHQDSDALQLTITSVIQQAAVKTCAHFFVLENRLTNSVKTVIQTLIPHPHRLTFLQLPASLKLAYPTDNLRAQKTYYQLMAPKLLFQQKIYRAIYLEVGHQVQQDLTPFFQIELSPKIIGALPLETQYQKTFSTTILLINTVAWEVAEVSERALHFIQHQTLTNLFAGRTALHHTLVGRVQLLKNWQAILAQPLFSSPANNQSTPQKRHVFQPPLSLTARNRRTMPVQETKTSKTINIAVVTADYLVEPLSILMTSILENNHQQQAYTFYVIAETLTTREQTLLRQVTSLYAADIQFIEAQVPSYLQPYDLKTRLLYYRTTLASLLPYKVKKVLYLDCDILCTADLTRLWRVPLGQHLLGAVEDLKKRHRLEHMPIASQNTRFFNAGVMLLNLTRWRQQKIAKQLQLRIKNQIKHHRTLRITDALNLVLHDHWIQLHPEWNAQTALFIDPIFSSNPLRANQLKAAFKSPALVHFCGPEKPWLTDNPHPFIPQYRFYQYKLAEKSPSPLTSDIDFNSSAITKP